VLGAGCYSAIALSPEVCPGDSVPRRQCAQETVCPGDSVVRQAHLAETTKDYVDYKPSNPRE